MDSPSVQTMLGASGACPEIIHNSKIWKIGHPTQRAKATLEELVIGKATAEILSLKKTLPLEAYAELFESLRVAISAGEYKTGGAGWAKVVFTGLGAPLFLLSLLRENHPDATEKDARELSAHHPELVQLALARVIPGFFDLLLADMPLPPDSRAKVEAAMQSVKAMLLPPSPPSPGTAM